MLSKLAIAAVLTMSATMDVAAATDQHFVPESEGPKTYDDFLRNARIKYGLENVLLKTPEERKADRKFTHLRIKLIEDQEDERDELENNPLATEDDWDNFYEKYREKWDKYRKATQKSYDKIQKQKLIDDAIKGQAIVNDELSQLQDYVEKNRLKHIQSKKDADLKVDDLDDSDEIDELTANIVKQKAKLAEINAKIEAITAQQKDGQQPSFTPKKESDQFGFDDEPLVSIPTKKPKKSKKGKKKGSVTESLLSYQDMADKYLELDGWKQHGGQPTDEAIEQMKKLQGEWGWSDHCQQWSKYWNSQDRDIQQKYLTKCLDGLGNALSKDGEQAQRFWNVKDSSSVPQKVTVSFDQLNSLIKVSSDDVDSQGQPVNEWQMDQSTGRITIYDRHGSKVQITHRDAFSDDISDDSQTISSDLLKQRDIAYKILYFFFAFILFTMILVFAFVQQLKHSEEYAHKSNIKYPHGNLRSHNQGSKQRESRTDNTNGSTNLENLWENLNNESSSGRTEDKTNAKNGQQHYEFNMTNF